ncbi:MAG: radical SAM protein [Myxococcales bacterium]|nr:radical SAM protein [Myxococcales bacterium]
MTPSSESHGVFRSSRYNLCIPTEGGALLYNTLRGGVLQGDGTRSRDSMRALAQPGVVVSEDAVPPDHLLALVEGGFLVPDGTDEIAVVKERYDRARDQAPIALTVTTTMDCNLGCYYCYEERTNDRLTITEDLEPLVNLAREKLRRAGKRFLHVDWYGGEPLLNQEFMEAASAGIQAMCREEGVTYQASIISNGTRWPSDVAGFIRRHRVAEVQVTFDGMQANHDKRRHYRAGHRRPEDRSSFEVLVSLVDQLLECVQVDLRLNIDDGNAADFVELVHFARKRGWFERAFPVEIHPARLSKYSERSAFMRKVELTPEEFASVRRDIEDAVPETAPVQVQDPFKPDGFSGPRTTVCAALATDSAVVGADRNVYRCGLQVGDTKRAVGAVARKHRLPVLGADRDDGAFWEGFDPTTMPRCRHCTFLPLCWSGCPKAHLEGDEQAIREHGDYWRANLPHLVAADVGLTLPPDLVFSPSEQFKEGEPVPFGSTTA